MVPHHRVGVASWQQIPPQAPVLRDPLHRIVGHPLPLWRMEDDGHVVDCLGGEGLDGSYWVMLLQNGEQREVGFFGGADAAVKWAVDREHDLRGRGWVKTL
jgi:hypothetical protein